jgi:GrpB-like predicted nucleotidyltransferase (UPF0157 family)
LEALMSVDEPVSLSAHDPLWPVAAAEEMERIASSLGTSAGNLEHIGSTAVSGLLAKPVVDLMLGVKSYPPSDSLQEEIRRLGYESLGEAGVAGRLYFRKRTGRWVNLHIVQFDGQHWLQNLAVRDFLRNDIDARRRYAEAKMTAVKAGANTLLAYSAAKAGVIAELVAKASAMHDE